MIILKFFLQTLLVCIFAFSSAYSSGIVQLVAEIGQPAEDFPPGFVYWGFDLPVLSPSGHIAFSGAADTSVRATENNTRAVWSGRPGNLKVLIKENDILANVPQNVRFRSALESSLIANTSGHVAFMAKLQGNVSSHNEIALLAHVDGNTFLAMQTDQPAPGLPIGSVIKSIRDFVFTNAGLLIMAEASGPAFHGQGLWFWNFSTLEFIPSPIMGCNYATICGLSLNRDGEAAFILLLSNDTGALCNPPRGIFRWKNGQTQAIVIDNDPVPGMTATTFTLGLFPLKTIVTDQGEIIFTAVLRDAINAELTSSAWIARSNDHLDLLVMNGESLPDNSDPGNILNNSDLFTNLEATDNGLSIIKTTRKANRSTAIAFGKPRTSQPYGNIQDAGTSQLSMIMQLNDQLPGLDATWFTGVLTGEVAINKAGQFSFSSVIASTSDIASSQRTAIWRGTEKMETELAASTGMTLFADGRVRRLEKIIRLNRFFDTPKNGGSTVGGSLTQFSDQGEIIFAGNLDNNPGGIFLVNSGKQEKRIFKLAEQLFPQFFSPANPRDQNAEGFWYRYYSNTNTYIGIRGEDVFVLGEAFGPGIQHFETVGNTLHFLEKITQPAP
jgi:hypothetical protein